MLLPPTEKVQSAPMGGLAVLESGSNVSLRLTRLVARRSLPITTYLRAP